MAIGVDDENVIEVIHGIYFRFDSDGLSFFLSRLTPHALSSPAIHFLYQAVVEELRWLGLFRLGNCFRQKVKNTLNSGL